MFCLSDSIAFGVYAASRAAGFTIPDDLSLAGFGDHPISRLLAPALTSTFWDVEQAAGLATGFLLETLGADGDRPTLREVVAPALVTRGSTSRS